MWPRAERRAVLSQHLSEFAVWICHIDGTICETNRANTIEHNRYYNNSKRMDCFNKVVELDHDGFFINVEAEFSGSFHDVRRLRNTKLNTSLRQYFKCGSSDEFQEYLLGDPGYVSSNSYIPRRIDRREFANCGNDPVVNAFSRRHAQQLVEVRWGIGGLQNSFRRLLSDFPNRWDRNAGLLIVCAKLTKFLHWGRLNFSIQYEWSAATKTSGIRSSSWT